MSVTPVGPRLPADHLDKVVHLCEYLLLAWLLLHAIRATSGPGSDARLTAWLCAASYGVLIEVLQGFLPWRSAELLDAGANAVGAAIGVWLTRGKG